MINIVSATMTEADALVKALGLKRVRASLPLFQSEIENRKISLVVSGIGKCKAGAACAWLAGLTENRLNNTRSRQSHCWLNIGIAGHGNAALGSVFTANKIVDHQTGTAWYPAHIGSPLTSTTVVTVAKPLREYLPDQLHDMEASGFVEIARMYSYAELVQSVKVVSDNNLHPLSEVNATTARELMADNTQKIIELVDHMTELSNSLLSNGVQIDSDLTEQFTRRWQFSVSQGVTLERLLQRYTTLHAPLSGIPDEIKNSKSSREVIAWFKDQLHNANFAQ